MKLTISSLCLIFLSISVISCSLKKLKNPTESLFNPEEQNKGAVIGISSDLINDYIKEVLPQLAKSIKDMPLPVNDKDLYKDYYLSNLSLSFNSTNPANILKIKLVEPDGVVVDAENLTFSGKAKVQQHKTSNFAELTFEVNIKNILMHLQLTVFRNGKKNIPGVSIKDLGLKYAQRIQFEKAKGLKFIILAKFGNLSLAQGIFTSLLKHYFDKNLNTSIKETINKLIESTLSSVNPTLPINNQLLKGNLNLSLEKRPTIKKGVLYVNVDGKLLPMNTTSATPITTTPTTQTKKLKRKLRRRFKKF